MIGAGANEVVRYPAGLIPFSRPRSQLMARPDDPDLEPT
jgi:hypothetical protein